MPPQLPPRSPSEASIVSNDNGSFSPISPYRANTVHLTPVTIPNHPYSHHGGLNDPRSSSTQSLRPVESPGPNRRTLLVVYIHGFLGDETSFRSFPAHIHSLLTITLAESHVVHTKIYPRYRSRKNVSFARDGFSNWLTPHESETTDVILIGHSLGGILGAEVVLLPSHTPGSRNAFQHRILGLIAYDTPFLGMHPGVVSTGIASLFRGAPEQPQSPGETSSSSIPEPWRPHDTTMNDPNYNPTFTNDIKLPIRNGKLERAWYFWNKHSGELRKATQSYVKSHLEFGGCLADIPGLKKRYDHIRSLEDLNDLQNPTDQEGKVLHRVRFVNYYTASTGRIKEQVLPPSDTHLTTSVEMQALESPSTDHMNENTNRPITPRLSLDDHDEHRIVNTMGQVRIDGDEDCLESLRSTSPRPQEELELSQQPAFPETSIHDDLPPLPAEPIEPTALDSAHFTTADALHLAEKDQARRVKAYERAKKDHQKAIRERQKVIEKRERQAKKEQDKQTKMIQREQEKVRKEKQKRQSTLNPEDHDNQIREEDRAQPENSSKKQKDRKFCVLPAKDQRGQRDPTWVRVYMEGMDEVVAHTSLFFVSDVYAKLVSDTTERIEQWVMDDATNRLIQSNT